MTVNKRCGHKRHLQNGGCIKAPDDGDNFRRPVNRHLHKETHTHQLELNVMQANNQGETQSLNTQITDQRNETQLG